jgi:transposase
VTYPSSSPEGPIVPRPREGHRRRFGEADKRRILEEAGVLQQDPFTGHLFVFRGRTRANLIKIIYWDGTGFCLFTKRLEHGVFLWPPSIEPGETLSLTSAQLSLLIEGVDWRAPEQRWRPALAG